jgi:hypothetical protein
MMLNIKHKSRVTGEFVHEWMGELVHEWPENFFTSDRNFVTSVIINEWGPVFSIMSSILFKNTMYYKCTRNI